MATKTDNGAKAALAAEAFDIPRPEVRGVTLELEGLSGLIMHRWSEQALKQLEGSQTGKAKALKKARNGEEEAHAAAYVVPGCEDWEHGKPGKYCFPAAAFKHAFLYGVSLVDDRSNFPKTKAASWVFVDDDPVLGFDSMVIRTDTGRIGKGTSTMIYRPMFTDWRLNLDVSFASNFITAEQVAAIFDLGGTGGIGDWRPTSPNNKSGSYGRFRVVGITERR